MAFIIALAIYDSWIDLAVPALRPFFASGYADVGDIIGI